MKRIEMVKANKDFQEIIHNKKFVTNKLFTIYLKSYPQSYPQFGIAVKKSYGDSVDRNKIKRQVRFLVDTYKKEFKNSAKYIIMIKNTCKYVSFQELESSFTSLIKEIKWTKKLKLEY